MKRLRHRARVVTPDPVNRRVPRELSNMGPYWIYRPAWNNVFYLIRVAAIVVYRGWRVQSASSGVTPMSRSPIMEDARCRV